VSNTPVKAIMKTTMLANKPAKRWAQKTHLLNVEKFI